MSEYALSFALATAVLGLVLALFATGLAAGGGIAESAFSTAVPITVGLHAWSAARADPPSAAPDAWVIPPEAGSPRRRDRFDVLTGFDRRVRIEGLD